MTKFERDLGEIRKKIERFVNALPVGHKDEAFVFTILFRRKWISVSSPEEESEIRRKFGGSEMCVLREVFVADMDKNELAEEVYKMWKAIPDRYVVTRGRKIPAGELYEEFPEAFRMMGTFEPRSLKKAAQSFFTRFVNIVSEAGFNGQGDDLIAFTRRLPSEWKTVVHKSTRERGREKFLLLDVDASPDPNVVSEHVDLKTHVEKAFEMILEHFERTGILHSLRYYVRTPNNGMHFIFAIDSLVQDVIFKKRPHFLVSLKALLKKLMFNTKDLEIETGQVLTHIGGSVPNFEEHGNGREQKKSVKQP